MFPHNHKTIFVLDHTPYFGISSEDPLEIDTTKSRGPGYIPCAPITKSLWTCSVEAAVEYCRIAWDLFPTGKLVRFIVSDLTAHTLNTWSAAEQNTSNLLFNLAFLGSPRSLQSSGDFSVLHGLHAAVQSLSECSAQQHERRTSLTENASKVLNKCRVICITSTRDNASIHSIEDIFLNQLSQQNIKAASSDNLMPIDHCDLVIINAFPNTSESQVTGHPPREINAILTSEVHSVPAGRGIAFKLSSLILKHYDLASTTVTGIPMKEEQNASSSANYDVEIYHPSASHVSILTGNAADSALIRSLRVGSEYETLTLKWVTPRGCHASDMMTCIATHRITPVDVNSRPSSCLINFLLNGRPVMLEMPRKAGGKMASHLLTAHNNEVFIHTLATARTVLEDPPSISEGCGGRVTDYRITDFGEFMRRNRIIPLRMPPPGPGAPTPLASMKARIERHTKSWPMTISSTFIFNLKNYIEPLPTLMVKEHLTRDEVIQCKQVIFGLMSLEAKNESLQTPNTGQRGKGPKRWLLTVPCAPRPQTPLPVGMSPSGRPTNVQIIDPKTFQREMQKYIRDTRRREEQYRTMWLELEAFVKAHGRSDGHNQVIHCLLECRNKTGHAIMLKQDKGNKDDKVELDQALMELELVGKTDGGESSRASVIRATTDSPMSPPATGPIGLLPRPHQAPSIYSGPKTLLDLVLAKNAAASQAASRPVFDGLLRAETNATGGMITKLYPNLKKATEGDAGEATK